MSYFYQKPGFEANSAVLSSPNTHSVQGHQLRSQGFSSQYGRCPAHTAGLEPRDASREDLDLVRATVANIFKANGFE